MNAYHPRVKTTPPVWIKSIAFSATAQLVSMVTCVRVIRITAPQRYVTCSFHYQIYILHRLYQRYSITEDVKVHFSEILKVIVFSRSLLDRNYMHKSIFKRKPIVFKILWYQNNKMQGASGSFYLGKVYLKKLQHDWNEAKSTSLSYYLSPMWFIWGQLISLTNPIHRIPGQLL